MSEPRYPLSEPEFAEFKLLLYSNNYLQNEKHHFFNSGNSLILRILVQTILCLLLLIGCADIPEDLLDETNGRKFDYCVFDKQSMCLTGTFTYKDCNGKPSDKCPYGSPKKCDGMYNPSTSFCYNGNAYLKCNGMEYNPEIYICQGDVANPAKCGGSSYNPLEQRCQNNSVESKCGTDWYRISNTNLRCKDDAIETKCGTDWYDAFNTNLRCQSNVIETKCGTGWYNQANQRCENDVVRTKCGTSYYDPEIQFCNGNNIVSKCGGSEYYPATQFCDDNSLYYKCDGKNYTPANQRCTYNVIETKCGTDWYNQENQTCENNVIRTRCGTGSYHDPATQFCNGNEALNKCGGYEYNPTTQFCNSSNIYNKCDGKNYAPANQRCENKIIESQCGINGWYNATNTDLRCYNGIVETKCGTGWHNSLTQFCAENSVYNKCGGSEYYPGTQFCSGNSVYNKCDGKNYAPATQFCQTETNVVKSLCGTQTYTATQFCQSPNVVKPLCGTETYTSSQFCQTETNAVLPLCGTQTYTATQFCQSPNVVKPLCGTETYLATEQCCGSSKYTIAAMQYCSNNVIKTHKTVVIGTQTWIAENLNYDVGGSKCYNNQESNCDTYGRLYDWSTAMGFDASCNSTTCSGQVETPHQGICPDGWHIPSNAEWTTLINYVESEKGCSSCAGTHLKTTSGWSSYSGIVNLDSYGFSALPGGGGYSDGYFNDVGYYGRWWSASEYNSGSAYYRSMYYDDEYAYYSYLNKNYLFSVRCLQD